MRKIFLFVLLLNVLYSDFVSYKKACDGGDMLGCYNLGVLYDSGNSVQQDYTKASRLYLKTCREGIIDGCYNLSKSSNEQAASIEETSATLEEISGNMKSNSHNAQELSGYTELLTNSANDGRNLANRTVEAIDHINQETTAINEAITVIDQIAFQTNILSLNAAVEAATAGEAGKGFAVVAGEVRNLAARSAEAASEIKALVESAQVKAEDGKEISANMIAGYEELNGNIQKTMELISELIMANKEQEIGIEQLSNTMNQLDQITQQNASVAQETNDIAKNSKLIADNIVEEAQKNIVS